MLATSELRAWLRLLLTPGVGRRSARELLSAAGGPEAVFDAGEDAFSAQLGTKAEALRTPPPELDAHVARTGDWLSGAPQRRLIPLGDPDYPPLLLESGDPPLLLFAQGRIELLQRPAIAIVGSRRCTAQGREHARRFASAFSAQGFAVVSGLAHGIDGAAHEGGLAHDGSTIAVVGTGLDRVYPPDHRPLARRIAEHGLILSEFPLATPPLPENFPMRNRLIAGVSLGTLVVEAALRSGSLITARLAAEMGREVFAIPGAVHSEQARGCHALIRQGAKLVESPEEVTEELHPEWMPSSAAGLSAVAGQQPPGSPKADPILDALEGGPLTLDQLVAQTGIDAGTLQARLLDLELDGAVARLPGGLFQRIGRA